MKKFNVSHNTYKNFKEIEKLPEIGDNYDGRKVIAINEIGMDCEQPFDDNFNYDLHEIVCEDEDVNTVEWYDILNSIQSVRVCYTFRQILFCP